VAAHAGAADADVEVLRQQQQVLLCLLGQASADPAALHKLYQELLRHGVIAKEALPAPGETAVPDRDAGAAAPPGGAALAPGPPSRFEQDFERLELLGRGAFGEVWRCRHRLDGHEYAVKMVQFRSRAADGDRLRQRVAREVEVQASLAHPGIVRYHTSWVEGHWVYNQETRTHDSRPKHVIEAVSGGSSAAASFLEESGGSGVTFGEASSAGTVELEPLPPAEIVPALGEPEFRATLYIQSELCSKDTLQSWIAQRNAAFASGQLTEEQREQWNREACGIFAQVVDAVAHLHTQSCVHRDIKPSNILFARDGRVRVADFGLAKDSSGELGSWGALPEGRPSGLTASLPGTRGVGTPAYASPEQLAGAAAGSAGDVYSLGVMLAELLCPVQTQMERSKLIEELRNSGRLPSSVHLASPVVERMVMDMTHPAPTARPTAWEIALNVPRLFSEVQRHVRACALHLTLPGAVELPSAPRSAAATPVFQEAPITNVAIQPLIKWSPPAHVDAPEHQLRERPAGDLQQVGGRPALEAEAAEDVQGQERQIEVSDSQPELSLRISAGRQAPPVRVLRAAPGQANIIQGLWRAAGLRDLGRPAAPRAEDDDDDCGDEEREEGEARQNQTIQAIIVASAVNRGGGGGERDLFAPLAWYAAQLFPFMLRLMSDPKAWS
jgi:serine/threonine protein kinase